MAIFPCVCMAGRSSSITSSAQSSPFSLIEVTASLKSSLSVCTDPVRSDQNGVIAENTSGALKCVMLYAVKEC